MKSSQLIRILIKAGWYIVRQKGSHVIMKHLVDNKQIVVPMHGAREVHKGLEREILKMAGLNKEGGTNEKN